MVAEMLNTYYGERLAPEHMYTPSRSIPMSPPTGQSPPTEAIRSSHQSDQCYPLVFQRPVWGHEHCFSYLPPCPPAYNQDVMPRTINSPCPNPYFYRNDLDNSAGHSGYFCPEQSKTALYRSQNDHASDDTASSREESGRVIVDKPLPSGSVSDLSSPGQTIPFNEYSVDSLAHRVEDDSEQLCNRKLVPKSSVLVKNISHKKTISVPKNISNGSEMIHPSCLDHECKSCSPASSEKSSAVQTIVKQNARGPEKLKKLFSPKSTDLPKDLSKPSPTSPVVQPQSPFQGSGASENATPKGRRKTAAGVKRKASVDEAADTDPKRPKHEDQHVLAPGQSECLLWACKLCKQNSVKAVKRKVATVRERQRVRILNEAYAVLKNVCCCNPDPRQPKLEILQSAIKYIESLKGILHVTAGCDWDSNESRSQSNSPYVNEAFHLYGEKSNLSSSSESLDSSPNVSSLDSLSQIVQRINPNTKSLLSAIAKNPENHER